MEEFRDSEELQSGNHKLISEWRMKNSLKITQKNKTRFIEKIQKKQDNKEIKY